MGCVALICLWRPPAPGVRCSQSRRRPAPYTMSQSWLDKALAPPRYMYTTYSLPQTLCLISRERVSHDNYNTILNSIIHPCYERHFDESSASLKWGDVLQDMLGFLIRPAIVSSNRGSYSRRCWAVQSLLFAAVLGCAIQNGVRQPLLVAYGPALPPSQHGPSPCLPGGPHTAASTPEPQQLPSSPAAPIPARTVTTKES